jgi:DNA-binding beta-propeller fold protein YncE
MSRTRLPFLVVLPVLFALAPSAHAVATKGYILTSDYASGTLSVVDLETREVTRDVADVSSDPVARCYRGLVYVVNRYGHDNIQVIDPAHGYATLRQLSVGNGTNPQDIAFASPSKAYVSRLGSPDLLIVDPSTGRTLGAIPLAAWADADGNPETAHLAVVGDLLLVALERLANFVPADTGLIAVVDMRADTVYDADPFTPGTQVVKLRGLNPGTDFSVLPAAGPQLDSHLYIGCSGRWGEWDGGIEDIVVPAQGGPPGVIRSAGFAITEAALGGDVLDVVAGDAGHPYAIVSDAAFETRLVSWDPATGRPIATLYAPGGYSLSDAALDGRGELYVCNSSFAAPGLLVFQTGSDRCVAGPLATGLPPVQIVFDPDSPAIPPAGPVGDAVTLGLPAPNPARTVVRLDVTLAEPGPVRVDVFDLAGRRVRSLADGGFAARVTPLKWDLRDQGGRRLAAGVYVVRAATARRSVTRRLVVL